MESKEQKEITLAYRPHSYQREFHRDKSRFRIVAGGRRVGKTKCCIQEALKHCLSTENALCWWVAPSYKEARECAWSELQMYLEALRPAVYSTHESSMYVTFTNGSKLYFKGGDDIDRLRGRGLTMVVGDEAAFLKDNIWGTVLRPSLSDRKGKAVLISTPNGFNWFHTIFNNKEWSNYHWTSAMNPAIGDEELAAVRREISDIDFRQEYLSEFITRAGRIYQDFNEENVTSIHIDPTDKQWDIYLGLDFGFANPTAICFMAVNNLTYGKVVMFDEIYTARTQMEDIVSLIYSKLDAYGLRKQALKAIYCDPAGNSDELTSGISPVDTMRMAPHNLNVVNKASRINPGLALVRAWVKNTKGERRLSVQDNCPEAIRCFNGYQYDINRDGKIREEALKDNVHDHMMDAIRYFFVNRFDSTKYVADHPYQDNYGSVSKPKHVERCGHCRKQYLTTRVQPPFLCDKCTETING
jgi:PBSX family phage terminase large subunit